MQQIEDVIGEPLGLAARERILQGGEARHPVFAQHGDLAVQICGADLQGCEGCRERPKASGPVEAAASEACAPCRNRGGLRSAVAIPLDLVDPVTAGWRPCP